MYTSSYLMLRHSRSTKTLTMHRPLTVHAHLNALRQQHAGEGLAGELAALVGVEDLWPTLAQGPLSRAATQKSTSRVLGQPPGQHVAAVPVP